MLVDRNSVEARDALQYLILVQNSMYCAQVSKGFFVAGASLKKLEVKSPGSFCYCSEFVCIFFVWTLDFSTPLASLHDLTVKLQKWNDWSDTVLIGFCFQRFNSNIKKNWSDLLMSAIFHLKIKNGDCIVLKTPGGEKCLPSSLFVRTMFLGIFSELQWLEFRLYLHLFTKFPLKWSHF